MNVPPGQTYTAALSSILHNINTVTAGLNYRVCVYKVPSLTQQQDSVSLFFLLETNHM